MISCGEQALMARLTFETRLARQEASITGYQDAVRAGAVEGWIKLLNLSIQTLQPERMISWARKC